MEKRSQQAEQAASEGVKELTEKDAHSIVDCDDEELAGIVGGTEDPDVFSGSSSGPNWGND